MNTRYQIHTILHHFVFFADAVGEAIPIFTHTTYTATELNSPGPIRTFAFEKQTAKGINQKQNLPRRTTEQAAVRYQYI
jgi:hypothetical protein